MHILIDNKSGSPIYDQIYTQIKQQIIAGSLNEHEMLPSIRGLAKDLRISFVTTKRAYEELEKDGFLYTIPAKGCFVAPKNVELLREENLKKIDFLNLIQWMDINLNTFVQGFLKRTDMKMYP